MIEMIKTFVIGIFVGIAQVIPGVSGGTLVVIFNIYDKFVNAITLNIKKLIKNWKFVLPILLGIAFGIILFSKGIKALFNYYPVQTNFFFTGLIIGSIPLLAGYTFKSQHNEKLSAKKIAGLILAVISGLALILTFGILQQNYGDAKSAVNAAAELPELNAGLCIKLFIGGILGAFAMIIPGISGSLLMLIIGVYPIIISSISGLMAKSTIIQAIILLVPVGFGILVGLFAGAKLISSLIKAAPRYTYAVILGLIIGSAYLIIPFTEQTAIQFIISIICAAAGFCLAFFSSRFSLNEKNNSENEPINNKTDDQIKL